MGIKVKSQKSKVKKILITAGPTWVAIDKVRVISNIASGETGILLADKLSRGGAQVTLLLGPRENMSFLRKAACLPAGRESRCLDSPVKPGNDGFKTNKIKIVRFRFFEELRQALKKELEASKYDFIIHSAAVSDFAPRNPIRGKLKSDRPPVLKLKALPKISADIRRLAPEAGLVLFKLESGIKDEELIRRARKALSESRADLIVANSFGYGKPNYGLLANRLEPRYKAFIIDAKSIYSCCASKQETAKSLIAALEKEFKK